jgi:ABC-type dipeptide/oligopeptide/nickel transport system permease component
LSAWLSSALSSPCIGSYAVEALVASDYSAVQGFVLAMALLFVTRNLVIDRSCGHCRKP